MERGSRERVRLLELDGWGRVAVKGDHRQFKHPARKGRVTVRHPSKDIRPAVPIRDRRISRGIRRDVPLSRPRRRAVTVRERLDVTSFRVESAAPARDRCVGQRYAEDAL